MKKGTEDSQPAGRLPSSNQSSLSSSEKSATWVQPGFVHPEEKMTFPAKDVSWEGAKVSPDVGAVRTAGEEEESIKSLWTNFTETTNFHGFNKIRGARHVTFCCVYWSLAILGMAVFLIYNVATELSRYYKYPTMTDVKVNLLEEIEFPAVTLCNLSPFNATAMSVVPAMKHYMMSLSAMYWIYEDKINWSSPEYNNSIFNTPMTVDGLKPVSMSRYQMIPRCVFEGQDLPCSSILKAVPTDDGLCYVFNSNASNVLTTKVTGSNNHLTIYAVAFQEHYSYTTELSAGFKIFIHDPCETPTSNTLHVLAGTGSSTQIALTKIKFDYLPYPYKAFGERECLDTKGGNFVNPLRYFPNYTFGNCMLECRARFIYDQCNCTTLSDPLFGERCTLKQISTCYLGTRTLFETNVTAKESCECLQPCQFEQLSTQVSSSTFPADNWAKYFTSLGSTPTAEYAKTNVVELRIYFNSLMVTSISQKAEVTFETIMGNLGGQMGLCLGASILTVSELAEFLFFVTAAIWKRLHDPNRVQKLSN